MSIKDWLRTGLDDERSSQFKLVQGMLGGAVLISLGASGVEYFSPSYSSIIFILQWLITIIFTLEYVARVWVAPLKRTYVLSFFGLIDLVSILPSYLGLGTFTFLKAVRVVRALRALRLVSIGSSFRYFRRKE